ncbi:ABC transporter ATP-binding protein [Microtetraspora sp. AC03309]|uniref:ABC transporter ATP-binding protein n=1 Tax=Microtetraspora sp. AC03309 TaxID=2779376 RepID=UPI001E295B46|nr:ABC transporter ATP-binding protein [Microtetraspora sp. AC03309]MCC5578002.1 ABC transporter ATP-binding protein [Microtetraspora sp. AC03309]
MLIRLLRTDLRPHLGSIVLVGVLQIAQAVGALVLPTLNAILIDDGVLKGDTGLVLRTGGVMLAGTAAQVLCSAAVGFLASRVALAVGRDLRAAVFTRIQAFSAREVGRFGVPSLITRTVNDVQQVQTLVFMSLTGLAATPMMCAGGVVMALRQDARLSTLLLVALPALLVTLGVLLRRTRVPSQGVQEGIDTVNRVLREQITGVRVIRAFARDRHERARFAEANTRLMDMSVRASRLMMTLFPAGMLVSNLSGVALIWVGGHLIDDGSMRVGTLIAFLNYFMLIFGSALLATFTFLTAPRAQVSAGRIQEVLAVTPPPTQAASPPSVPALPGSPHRGLLEFRDVQLRYPGAELPVLRGVSLVARPGETTAIIGSTGAGKTTLLNLVPRLLDPTGGAVRVGGLDVAEMAPEDLVRAVALVPQRPYLFSGTIASNLRYGDPEATDAELWHALEIAQARDFVEALPEGLDTPVGQGGGSLSGGQRQRLTIARALVARPAVYLFDDPFSALDPVTERALRDALDHETRDATVLMVAQRVPSIRYADRIVVLDEGRVAGEGTHHELMASSGTYREIVLSQLTEEEAA